MGTEELKLDKITIIAKITKLQCLEEELNERLIFLIFKNCLVVCP